MGARTPTAQATTVRHPDDLRHVARLLRDKAAEEGAVATDVTLALAEFFARAADIRTTIVVLREAGSVDLVISAFEEEDNLLNALLAEPIAQVES